MTVQMRRRAVRLSGDDLVTTAPLDRTRGFGLEIDARAPGLDAVAWMTASRGTIDRHLLQYGAVLFRGFGIDDTATFERFAAASTGRLAEYRERAAPRIEVAANVFTSTEFPAAYAIPLHHEMSYSSAWPARILFYCAEPPRDRGCTPIAPARAVTARLDPRVRADCLARKVMYVRNFGEGVDLPWPEAFQTSDRAEVEAYCRSTGAACEWLSGERLRTRAVREPVVRHPRTGETVWFNHAHMFHSSNLDPSVRSRLMALFDHDELPRNALYGDGTPIPDGAVAAIRRAYDEEAFRFEWRRGDVLLLDNCLAAHGRDPFSGPRRILVAMGGS